MASATRRCSSRWRGSPRSGKETAEIQSTLFPYTTLFRSLGEVRGEQARDRIDPAAVDDLYGFGDAAVQQPVARLADLAIRHFHGQAGIEDIALFADSQRRNQASGAQLVERVERSRLRERGGAGDDFEVKFAPHCDGGVQHAASAVRQPREPGLD